MSKSAFAHTSQSNRNGVSRTAAAGIGRTQTDYRQVIQRAQVDPGSLTSQDVLTLQRSIGNRATVRLMQPVLQAKLKLGPAGDKYEQEADQVAAQVVGGAQTSAEAGAVQRNVVEEEEMIQGKEMHGPEGGEVEDGVQGQIQAARGGGKPLDEGVRRQMEQGFGADFSGVRVHTGQKADTLNRSLNARAFTTGKDIFFGKGEYQPKTFGGKKLLAHELTHTVQQSGADLQRAGVVQRFSDADVAPNAATDWAGETVRVTKSAAGLVSGVFFPEDNAGRKLVVKPEYADNDVRPTTAAQMQFADKALTQMGMSLPGSRIVKSSNNEFRVIVDTITSDNPTRLTQNDGTPYADDARTKIRTRLETAKYLKVMASVDGKSWGDVLGAIDSQQKADNFFQLLSGNNFAFVKNMAKMIVSDTLIGNDDRAFYKKEGIGTGFTGNVDNWMIANNSLVLIDSDASIGDLDGVGQAQGGAFKTAKGRGGEDMLNSIFEQRMDLAHTFAGTHIRNWFERVKTAQFDSLAYFDQWHTQHGQEIVDAFLAGIDDGLDQVSRIFGSKQHLQELKAEASAHGEGEEENLWATFKSRGNYLMGRAQGRTQQEALFQSSIYQQYKFTGGQGLGQDDTDRQIDGSVIDIHIPKLKKPSKKYEPKPSKASNKSSSKPDKKLPIEVRVRRTLNNGKIADRLNNVLDSENRVVPGSVDGVLKDRQYLRDEAQKLKKGAASEVLFLSDCLGLGLELKLTQGEVSDARRTVTGLKFTLKDETTSERVRIFAARKRDSLLHSNLDARLGKQVAILAQSVRNIYPALAQQSPQFAKRLLDMVEALELHHQILSEQLYRLAKTPDRPWGGIQKPLGPSDAQSGGMTIGRRPPRVIDEE